eukprot:TRINITY_DN4280_c0_g1_i1.p1 TRINITY_DN4280_c0_g1~~TRINITY_DN4280_c0_g1_i1.p1  ORF type:complete len:754 (-),score=14.65 TRINITY_DN4280_c0_g1_i1:141-2360(-)
MPYFFLDFTITFDKVKGNFKTPQCLECQRGNRHMLLVVVFRALSRQAPNACPKLGFSSLAPYSQYGNVLKKIRSSQELNNVLDLLTEKLGCGDIANIYYILPRLQDSNQNLQAVEGRLQKILLDNLDTLTGQDLAVILYSLTHSVVKSESSSSLVSRQIYVRRKETAFYLSRKALKKQIFDSADLRSMALISMSLSSCGNLNVEQQKVCQDILNQFSIQIKNGIIQPSKQMAKDVATMFHAFSKLGYFDWEMFENLAYWARMDVFVTGCTPREIHTIFVSCAKLKYQNSNLFSDLSKILVMQKNLQNMRIVDTAAIFYACGQLGYSNPEMFSQMVNALQQLDLAKECSAQDLGNILYGISHINYQDSTFIGMVFDALWQSDNLQRASGHNLVNFYDFMVKLQYKDSEVLRAMNNVLISRKFVPENRILGTRIEVGADRLALVIKLLGQLKYADNVLVVEALVKNLISMIEVFTPLSLQHIIQGLIHLQYKHVQLVRLIYNRCKEEDNYSTKLIPHLIHLYARFSLKAPDDLLHQFQSHLYHYNEPSLLCGLVYSLSILQQLTREVLCLCLELVARNECKPADVKYLGLGLYCWKYIQKGDDILEHNEVQLQAMQSWKDHVNNRTIGLFVRHILKQLQEAGINHQQNVLVNQGVETVDLLLQDDKKRCILIFGQGQFTLNEPYCLLGDAVLRIQLLKGLGYDVGYLSQKQWDKYNSKDCQQYVMDFVQNQQSNLVVYSSD